MEELTNTQAPLFDFKEEKKSFDDIISGWSEETERCKVRRDLRENRKNVKEERVKGTILGDETIIPARTINTNIKRGRIPYLNYTTQSQNILILQDKINPSYDTEQLQSWFTRGMRFANKWKQPWLRLLDAMLLHGGCALEVIYDPTKPCNVALDFIPRDELLFSKKTKDLQAQGALLRKFELTKLQLEEFAQRYEFKPEIVANLVAKSRPTDQLITIYRALMKKKGVVYNAWYAFDNANDWLRAPIQHDIGLFDIDVFDPEFAAAATSPTFTQEQPEHVDLTTGQLVPATPAARDSFAVPQPLANYPIIWFKMDEQEDLELLKIQGRAALDSHIQEAMTHLITNVVNATTRASNFYPTAKNEPGDNTVGKELGPLVHGRITSGEIAVWQAPWPNASSLLAVADHLQAGNDAETGSQDYAAVARKDANKTATEMDLAASFSKEQSGSELMVYSNPYLEVYTLCFEVARQQAIMQLCIPPVDPECLFHDYHITAAADTEVVKREEDKQNAKQFFEIVKGTPAASKILMFLMQKFFPDQAKEWNEALAQPDLAGALMQAVKLLQSIPQDEIPPEQRSALGSFIANAQSMVGPPADAAAAGQSPVAA